MHPPSSTKRGPVVTRLNYTGNHAASRSLGSSGNGWGLKIVYGVAFLIIMFQVFYLGSESSEPSLQISSQDISQKSSSSALRGGPPVNASPLHQSMSSSFSSVEETNDYGSATVEPTDEDSSIPSEEEEVIDLTTEAPTDEDTEEDTDEDTKSIDIDEDDESTDEPTEDLDSGSDGVGDSWDI